MKTRSLAAVVTLALALVACGESELHGAMEGMGESYKSMKEAPALADMKGQLAVFKAELDIARQQVVKPEHQAEFDEGLEKVGQLTAQLTLAVESGDINSARALLEKLRDLRKQYHEKLGVK